MQEQENGQDFAQGYGGTDYSTDPLSIVGRVVAGMHGQEPANFQGEGGSFPPKFELQSFFQGTPFEGAARSMKNNHIGWVTAWVICIDEKNQFWMEPSTQVNPRAHGSWVMDIARYRNKYVINHQDLENKGYRAKMGLLKEKDAKSRGYIRLFPSKAEHREHASNGTWGELRIGLPIINWLKNLVSRKK